VGRTSLRELPKLVPCFKKLLPYVKASLCHYVKWCKWWVDWKKWGNEYQEKIKGGTRWGQIKTAAGAAVLVDELDYSALSSLMLKGAYQHTRKDGMVAIITKIK